MNNGCSFFCLTAYVPRIEWIPGVLSSVSQLTCLVLNEYRVFFLLPHSLRASYLIATGCSFSCLTAYVPLIEWIPGAFSPVSQLTCLVLNEYLVLFLLPHSLRASYLIATGCSFSCLTAYVPSIEWLPGAFFLVMLPAIEDGYLHWVPRLTISGAISPFSLRIMVCTRKTSPLPSVHWTW
jgi:hypothetical protein